VRRNCSACLVIWVCDIAMADWERQKTWRCELPADGDQTGRTAVPVTHEDLENGVQYAMVKTRLTADDPCLAALFFSQNRKKRMKRSCSRQ
jgi:hypothetical protein